MQWHNTMTCNKIFARTKWWLPPPPPLGNDIGWEMGFGNRCQSPQLRGKGDHKPAETVANHPNSEAKATTNRQDNPKSNSTYLTCGSIHQSIPAHCTNIGNRYISKYPTPFNTSRDIEM